MTILAHDVSIRSRKTPLLVGIPIFVLPVFVSAQMVPSSTPSAVSPALELQEIVVTATRREATVLDTPISITAVSGEQIQERGFTDFASLAATVPGVSFQTSGPGQTEFEMRGLTSSGGNSPTVGFYLDDTPLTAPAAGDFGKVVIDPTVYDLNRVEVLRGPQGTLFGSSSMGGTIRLITNQPDPQGVDASSQVIFSGTEGGGFNHGENAMLNLPLVDDRAALRIVGSQSSTSGWIDRIVAAPGDFPVANGNIRGNVQAAPIAADYTHVNNEDSTGARVALLVKPIDGLSITPSLFYQNITTGGPSAFDSDPGTKAHYEPFDVPERFSDRFTLWTLNAKYQAPGFDVTSNTSHWNRSSANSQDASETTQFAFGLPSYYPPYGIGAVQFVTLDRTAELTQELRLTSSGHTRFTWLVGAFYSNFTSTANDTSQVPGLVPFFGTANLFTAYQPATIKQTALFGEVAYEVAPRLTATVGLRGYHYDTSFDSTTSGVAGPTGTDEPSYAHAGASDKGLNPKFDLSYKPDQDLTIYTTAAKGFRPGGGNAPVPTSGSSEGAACLANLQSVGLNQAPAAFSPDTVWSYELGEKARFLEKALSINADLFYENWQGIQQGVLLPCGFEFNENGGAARIYGAEVEVNATLPYGLNLSVNGSYNHGRISQGNAAADTVLGDHLEAVPDWTGSARISYHHAITDRLSLTALLENDYVGHRYDLAYIALTPIKAYDLTNFRVGFAMPRWSAFLFANNLFNEKAYLAYQGQIGAYVPTFNRVTTNQPLTIGIDVSYKFR
jgi:iron complex outermembrane receptor protein